MKLNAEFEIPSGLFHVSNNVYHDIGWDGSYASPGLWHVVGNSSLSNFYAVSIDDIQVCVTHDVSSSSLYRAPVVSLKDLIVIANT